MPEAAEDSRAVRIQGVEFAYPGADRPLLAGLDLALERGELAAVLGPSGVGKSTLLNLVAGLAVPRAGRVEVLGTEVTGLNESKAARWRRGSLGFVFQQFHLLPYLTVSENVALPLALNGQRWEEEAVRSFLERLGLGEQAASYPRHLSGGQAQRAAIARALIHRPPVLLADELTGNLDEETAVAVMDLLVEAVEELGTTTLVVTHAPEVASRSHTRYRLSHHRLHREP
ncbi:ABC transporter ATP-binding protein [Thiohalorhabdus sp. Cl-TMA]|uniref:ABC transporter ATP-binding protein n=1 Tax=Thiohalorhabdus methylotrophus TaxID=3242694 RepID=A0ABV4TUD4_9GAMM